MGTLPWTLADFPEGYVLLLHKSPRRTEPSITRRDFYLYGAWCLLCSFLLICLFSSPSYRSRTWHWRPLCAGATDVPSFASPLEFVKHAEWLTRGAHRTLDTRRSPRCSCKYCSQNAYAGRDGEASGSSSGTNLKNREKKQSVISRGLRRVRAGVLARIKTGDGDEDVDEMMDNEEAEGDAEAEVMAAADADADMAEAEAQNGIGVDTNVVNTEPNNTVFANDHGSNDD